MFNRNRREFITRRGGMATCGAGAAAGDASGWISQRCFANRVGISRRCIP